MDLNTVQEVVRATSRADLAGWGADTGALAGGTVLFSEPHDHLRRLVDLTQMRWPSLRIDEHGLEIAATCTVRELGTAGLPAGWQAEPLLARCAEAFLASVKVQRFATVGGNLCVAYPAGPMISLTAALDGQVLVWTPDGGEYRLPVVDFIVGNCRSVLHPGEILRSVHLPAVALRSLTAFRKIALSPLGRSAAVIIGRRGDDATTVTVSAATVRPVVLRWPEPPTAQQLSDAIDDIDPALWHDDAHGSPDWRHAVSRLLADEIRAELVDTDRGARA